MRYFQKWSSGKNFQTFGSCQTNLFSAKANIYLTSTRVCLQYDRSYTKRVHLMKFLKLIGALEISLQKGARGSNVIYSPELKLIARTQHVGVVALYNAETKQRIGPEPCG
jgi:hypothetical protein